MRTLGVDWALVGGFAVAAYAGGRATADVDVAVAVDSAQAVDRMVFALRSLGYEVGPVLEDTETGRPATVRMFAPETGGRRVLVDFLVETSGIEAEVVAAASRRAVRPGFEIPIARLGHLIALKVLSERDDRLQDRIDLQNMLAVANEEELARAREGIHLIAGRGRGRGKDLQLRFEEFLAQARSEQ
jgi:hypothetical protein